MVGRTVLQYQLLEKLGAGGMGDIYKALDTRLNRTVAIKVLTKAATGDLERKRRFIQEAQAASALNHPNIITIHDIISEGDTEFMVMEYVNGKTLVDLIPKGGLRVPQALKYSVQMADALQVAHNAGIVHRDLKPGNVMVTESGLVKILDFGLAKLTDRGPLSHVSETEATQNMGDAPLTVEGSIIGTVSYMSPEQAQGKKVDTRSDIFSFGVVLYEMLTGVRAFAGDSALSTLSAILRDEVKPIAATSPEVPPQVDLVISRCLRKLPDDRWQSMKDVQMALSALKHESDSGMLYRARLSQIQAPLSAPPPAQSVKAAVAPVPVSKKGFPPAVLAAVSAVVLLGVIVGGSAWLKHRRNAALTAQVAVATAPVPVPPPTDTPAPAPPPDATAPDTPAAPPADATLTNDSIVELVKEKVSPSVIMSQIRSSKTNFTLTTAELIRLTHAGVPDNVIEQMRNPKRAVTASVTSPAPTSAPKQTPSVSAPPPQQPQQPQPQPQPQPVVQPPPPQQTTQEAAPPPVQPQPPPKPVVSTVMVVLNDGTPFNIKLAEDVPEAAEEGRPLRFTVTDDVRLGDAVAIAKGATVTGAIAEKKKGLFGKMTLKLLQAETVDGKKLNVRALPSRRAEGSYRPVDTGVRKPKDVEASAGTAYVAYIDGNQTVAAHK